MVMRPKRYFLVEYQDSNNETQYHVLDKYGRLKQWCREAIDDLDGKLIPTDDNNIPIQELKQIMVDRGYKVKRVKVKISRKGEPLLIHSETPKSDLIKVRLGMGWRLYPEHGTLDTVSEDE